MEFWEIQSVFRREMAVEEDKLWRSVWERKPCTLEVKRARRK